MARAKRVIPRPRSGTPTLAEVLREAISSRLLDLHTALPGKVTKYYPATGSQQATVDVQPMIRQATPASDGSTVLEDLPVIMNVPIGWMQTAAASLQLKLAAGDTGLLVFSEAADAQWRVTGALSEPGDLRRHDLSYATFMPCRAPDAKALPSMAGGEAVVLDANDVIRMGGPSAGFVALSGKVDSALSAIDTFLAAVKATLVGGIATVSGGAGTFTVPFAASPPTPASTAATKLKGE